MTVASPQTRAERTAYEETSRYDDVRAFIDALARQTPRIRVEMFGKSEEGRDLPLLVVGDPPPSAPPARSSRLPVVLVMANIHAGEVEGKEATLQLARRLTLGDLQPLLPSAVWLFAPIYNADGNEKVSLDNRVEQNGPIGGVGTRENAKGLDLNRDFMKLESSEARGLVGVVHAMGPGRHRRSAHDKRVLSRLSPDLRAAAQSKHRSDDRGVHARPTAAHRSRGDEHAATVFAPTTTATSPQPTRWRMSSKDFEPGETRQKVWRTFDARPRFGTNYGGIRNRIAILSEAYSYLDFERRVKATEAFTEEIMRFVAAHGAAIRSLTSRADAEWLAGKSHREQGIASELQALPKPVDVLVGAIGSKVNPRSGKSMRTMIETTAIPTSMVVYDRFVSAATRRVPAEYIVPASANGLHDVVERKLREHGIQVERAEKASRRTVEQFALTQVRQAEQAFQGHRATSIEGRFERRDIDVPAGSLVVSTKQPLGRLVVLFARTGKRRRPDDVELPGFRL